ncbi:MAG: ImmA/IrrE family metallo-endopeptidase [Planctomycetes bacterium]|nr:ImmA/IrrE family metallo-endopeptidase [Planctomycetota bacterium]
MERIRGINARRIEWCCDDSGITIEDLIIDLSISSKVFDKMMAGEDGLTFNKLKEIADYFGRGVMFFLERGPVDAERVHSPQFRTIAGQKPKLSPKLRGLVERVERQRDLYLSLLEDLGDEDMPRFIPPRLPANDLNKSAGIIRKWLGLSEHSERNDFESYRKAVEAKGLLVFRSNGYPGKWQIAKDIPVLGFSLYDHRYPVIFVKKTNPECRQSFTLMHELGHLLLHKTSFIDDERDFASDRGNEGEANDFAGRLLVPDSFLECIRDSDKPEHVSEYGNWLSKERVLWGVSVDVILLALKRVGRLSEQKYNAYKKWCEGLPESQSDGGSREWRHREPTHIFGDNFVRTVLEAYYAGHITLSKTGKYLDNLKIKDLHKLEDYYEARL